MDAAAYFRSLAAEFDALKNRVRHFIHQTHSQTDGEWKESVLRAVLNRNLPNNVEALRGFVLTETRGTRQLDILLYDNTRPALFREGDLVFVTPDAVKGIIEVKTRVRNRSELSEFVDTLSKNAALILDPERGGFPHERFFVGLFAFDCHIRVPPPRRHDRGPHDIEQEQEVKEQIMEPLQDSAEENNGIVNHVALGDSAFVRFWENRPYAGERHRAYRHWHLYNMDQMAFGYFVNNVLFSVAPFSVSANARMYFPEGGKESRLVTTAPLRGQSAHFQDDSEDQPNDDPDDFPHVPPRPPPRLTHYASPRELEAATKEAAYYIWERLGRPILPKEEQDRTYYDALEMVRNTAT